MKYVIFISTFIIIILACIAFFSLTTQPQLRIVPETSLYDTPVEISLSNLKPHTMITIQAMRTFRDGSVWSSHASFIADNKGNIQLDKQAPISGSYSGIDGMGLFWSMTPTKSIEKSDKNDTVTLSIFAQDKLILQKIIHRLAASSNITQQDIQEDGIVGTLFYPKNIKAGPGIITLAGSSGGISKTVSQLLASHGYTVLALGYFAMPGLPDTLENIPLEYFQKAITWFKKQPQVNSESIGLWGISYGGQLVLLLGATFPDIINAIVAYVPSNLIYGGIPNLNSPSWTFNNKPLTYMPMPPLEDILKPDPNNSIPFHKGTPDDPLESSYLYLDGLEKFASLIPEATIPVENIRCPLLLLSGKEDKLWPSSLYTNLIMERLNLFKSPIIREQLQFQNAGHYFEMPYAPSVSSPYLHPVANVWLTMGGTPEGNAHASIEAWHTALSFLEKHLHSKYHA